MVAYQYFSTVYGNVSEKKRGGFSLFLDCSYRHGLKVIYEDVAYTVKWPEFN